MTTLLDEPATTIVTGGSGWFGRAYLAAIGAGGSDATGPVGRSSAVRVLVPVPGDVQSVLSVLPRSVVHVGDVTDPSALERLFEGGAGASVVHAAGVIHPKRVADFEAVNADGTANVLAAAKKTGVRRLVHVSSNSPFGVNPTPTDVFRHDEPYQPYLGYGRSKMLAEERVRAANGPDLETVVVRPPWFYGPWQPLRQTTFFRLIRTGKFPLIGDGSQRRSMVFVDNLVHGVALGERHPDAAGDAFWIADERPYAMLEILATVKQALRDEGFDVADRQVKLPALASKVAERIDRVLQGRGVYHQEFHVLGEMDKTIACDIGHSRDVLGFDPKVELHEGMRRSIRWCIEQGVEI